MKARIADMTAHRRATAMPEKPDGLKTRPPRKRPLHVSVYISDAVADEFKQLAIIHRCKPHDLYIRGFNLVLKDCGRPSIAEIDGTAANRDNDTTAQRGNDTAA
jgi:hypothetical protein